MATVYPTSGKGHTTGKEAGIVVTTMNQGAWGTGAGTSAVGDTTLFTEASEARVAATLTQQTTGVTNDTLQWVYTMTANGTKTVTNAGVFDAASGGVLGVKGDFGGIPVNSGDQITFTFKKQYT